MTDWTDEYGYDECTHCHGLYPLDDLVEQVCLWCWERRGPA